MTGVANFALFGLLGGIYISWSAFFRFRTAYREMCAAGITE
jgi:hypothetical protein